MKNTTAVVTCEPGSKSDRQNNSRTTVPVNATRASPPSRSRWRAGLAVAASLALSGCRTVSPIEPAGGASRIDLTTYEKVRVSEFVDQASNREQGKKRDEKIKQMQYPMQTFPDA
jgi:hypothetical protein